jgi:two-component system chemotaxis response regulator CheY
MSLKVLIVDDSPTMRRILKSALRCVLPGLTEVLHAANGWQGLDALVSSAAANQPLSLILCDLHMPQMDGLDFLRHKQRRNLAPNVPLLLITADPGNPRLLQAMAEGAQGFLTKPFTMQQVQERVVSVLHLPGK